MSNRKQEEVSVIEQAEVHSQFLTPFQRRLLLKSLQTELRLEYQRRIEIMLLADEGYSQAYICEKLGCSPETARFWMAITQTGQAHLWNERPVGRPKTVNDQYLERLKELVGCSPRDCGYPFQSWTAQWLSKHLAKELGIEISDRHVSRLLKKMGLSVQRRQSETTVDSLSANNSEKSSNIVINNLQSPSPPAFSELWPFKSIY